MEIEKIPIVWWPGCDYDLIKRQSEDGKIQINVGGKKKAEFIFIAKRLGLEFENVVEDFIGKWIKKRKALLDDGQTKITSWLRD